MTDVSITVLPAAPLHALEIWSNPATVAQRFKALAGFAMPVMGRFDGTDLLRLIRYEPSVWLVEGEVSGLSDVLADDGALTAVGGGVVRVRLSGTGWRTLLMEGGVFDAENPAFAPGCSATTIIDRIGGTRGCLTQARRARLAGKARQAGTGLACHASRARPAFPARLTPHVFLPSAIRSQPTIQHSSFAPHPLPLMFDFILAACAD